MNLAELQTYANALGVPVSAIILALVLWLTLLKPARDTFLPRWLAAQEQAAKAMQDISQIVKSLEYEVRESRKLSSENNERLAALDVKVDQIVYPTRANNGRTRKIGE